MKHEEDNMTINTDTNPISWDAYFMGVAKLSAMRSKDPNTQVGACIVDANNIIVGVGYNGMPCSRDGCNDNHYTWNRSADSKLDTKYPYVCHAELNAILNTNPSPRGKNYRIYVTLFPCNECAKIIIQSGIKEVIYFENKYSDSDEVKAAELMFKKSEVIVREYIPCSEVITIKL